MTLLPVEDALRMLLDSAERVGGERVALKAAAGRILAEPVHALRTQPPFDASAMDGYAVRSVDLVAIPARLTVIGEAPAGQRFAGSVGEAQAVRIFTGAPVPAGADAILIQENARMLDASTLEATETVAAGRHIRQAGLDFNEGELLLQAGRSLDPAALSLAAAANHAELCVVRRPRVAILATGDELLPPRSEPGPSQIISSNAYGVAAIAEAAGAETVDLGIAPDSRERIAAALLLAFRQEIEVVVTIGGASVGAHDLVREVLVELGVKLDFWKIAMRPGKPLMFGRRAGSRVLGLPGNPVASLVCSHLFLQPLVARLAGRAHRPDYREARLAAPLPANDERQDYIRARMEESPRGLIAAPFPVQDSSMLKTLAAADALIVREPRAPAAEAGEKCQVLMLR